MASGLPLPPVSGNGFWKMGQQHADSAIGAYGNMKPGQKTVAEPPGKTAGGAIGSAGGMAAAGFAVGGPWGAAIGAAVGLGSYLLS